MRHLHAKRTKQYEIQIKWIRETLNVSEWRTYRENSYGKKIWHGKRFGNESHSLIEKISVFYTFFVSGLVFIFLYVHIQIWEHSRQFLGYFELFLRIDVSTCNTQGEDSWGKCGE